MDNDVVPGRYRNDVDLLPPLVGVEQTRSEETSKFHIESNQASTAEATTPRNRHPTHLLFLVEGPLSYTNGDLVVFDGISVL